MRWLLVLGMLGWSGCYSCPSIYVASVNVEVVDSNGESIPGVEVTYTVDGGPVQEAECIRGVDEDICMAFWTRSGAGEFVITATLDVEDPADPTCAFSDAAVETVTVTSTRCGVEGQALTLELDATQRVCS